eukprot:TRINITY_DN3852_c0_g2_i2.p1 TRINITY_DN3852_c0_g2~~TRINITY_DN3852_c0_g2_i2.p1  ORF type:complete len:272 (+),score=86.84 TRINITY_DN3852_c0_g2_i2:51-866(+)
MSVWVRVDTDTPHHHSGDGGGGDNNHTTGRCTGTGMRFALSPWNTVGDVKRLIQEELGCSLEYQQLYLVCEKKNHPQMMGMGNTRGMVRFVDSNNIKNNNSSNSIDSGNSNSNSNNNSGSNSNSSNSSNSNNSNSSNSNTNTISNSNSNSTSNSTNTRITTPTSTPTSTHTSTPTSTRPRQPSPLLLTNELHNNDTLAAISSNIKEGISTDINLHLRHSLGGGCLIECGQDGTSTICCMLKIYGGGECGCCPCRECHWVWNDPHKDPDNYY